jgi:hypothetical protein
LIPHIARTLPTMEIAFSGERMEVVYHPKIPSIGRPHNIPCAIRRT